jgi:hypothetical protein
MGYAMAELQSTETSKEWHPSSGLVRAWTIASIPVLVAALVFYRAVSAGGHIPTSGWFEPLPTAVGLVVFVGLTVVHEAVHGVSMAALGARPEFGLIKIGGSNLGWGVYTTAPGHLFTKRQYCFVTAAPVVGLSLLGIPACASPLGDFMYLAFAFQLVGAVGDAAILWQTLHQPGDVLCEDRKDGVRFVRRTPR